jgi:hypothetical protein
VLHRWRRHALAAMRGPVGLGDHGDDIVTTSQRFKGG